MPSTKKSNDPMISVCILTKNCERTLASTLDSIKSFAEVILVDNGSVDSTLSIAKMYPNVVIHTSPFIGFGKLRNLAASYAKNDWILALDSDEIVSSTLLEEINCLSFDETICYALSRINYYNGKKIRGCGWDKEFVIRLYNKKMTQFSDAEVHESLQLNSKIKGVKKLKGELLHTPYLSISDFLIKMEHYSSLFAKQYKGKRKSSFTKAFFKGFFSFFRSYFLKKGIFCGKEGFIISFYNGSTTFFKYLKLYENV